MDKKVINSIFIDCNNKKQVKWWNTAGHKLVKQFGYQEIRETKTGNLVGLIIGISGPLKNYVIKKNRGFLGKDVSTMVIKK